MKLIKCSSGLWGTMFMAETVVLFLTSEWCSIWNPSLVIYIEQVDVSGVAWWRGQRSHSCDTPCGTRSWPKKVATLTLKCVLVSDRNQVNLLFVWYLPKLPFEYLNLITDPWYRNELQTKMTVWEIIQTVK